MTQASDIDFNELAVRILEVIGGSHNIKSLTCCQTIIRIGLHNLSLLKEQELHDMEGLIAFMNQKEEVQVVVGNQVDELFEMIKQEAGITSNEKKDDEVMVWYRNCCHFLSSIMLPVIPLLCGTVILKITLTLLSSFGAISSDGNLFVFFNYIADAILYFYPFAIGLSVCNQLGSNSYIGVILIGVLLQPYLNSVVNVKTIQMLDVPVKLSSYTVGILPIIFSLWVAYKLEVAFRQMINKKISSIIVPTLTVLVSLCIVLFFVGPITTMVANILSFFIIVLNNYGGTLAAAAIAVFIPIFLLFGVYYGQIPLGLILVGAIHSDSVLGPSVLVAFVAQGVAAIVIGLRSKNQTNRKLSLVSGFLALFGFAEPAIYAVSLKNAKVFLATLLGSAIGGLFFGIFDVGKGMNHLPGILSIADYQDGRLILLSLIGLLITTLVTVFLCTKVAVVEKLSAQESEDNEISVEYHKNKRNYEEEKEAFYHRPGQAIYSPLSGRLMPLSHVNDPIYSNEMMGKGVAILPSEGKVIAPIDGIIIILFDSLQGIGLKGDNGEEIFIHVGLDTINLKGLYFHAHVAIGDNVKVGDVLLTFEMEKMKELGYDLVTPVNLCNSDEYKEVVSLVHQDIKAGEVLIKVVRRWK